MRNTKVLVCVLYPRHHFLWSVPRNTNSGVHSSWIHCIPAHSNWIYCIPVTQNEKLEKLATRFGEEIHFILSDDVFRVSTQHSSILFHF